jgi:hypothetical protein
MFAHKLVDVCSNEMGQKPIPLITSPSLTITEAILWNNETGWISYQHSDGSRLWDLCWLPTERRGELFTRHGTTVAIGTRRGLVTILDFSDVVAMLKGLDQSHTK